MSKQLTFPGSSRKPMPPSTRHHRTAANLPGRQESLLPYPSQRKGHKEPTNHTDAYLLLAAAHGG